MNAGPAPPEPRRALCAVVLAAGAGTRLRPLTDHLPKALCPVGNVPLLDHALTRAAGLGLIGPDAVAVNAHHGAERIAAHVGTRATLSIEKPVALGTAGAIAALHDWIDGRDVVVLNADACLGPADRPGGDGAALVRLVHGRARDRVGLLVVRDPARSDFGDDRFAGTSVLPWSLARRLRPEPTGLHELVWRSELAAGRVDLVRHPGPFVDCGTPADYLAGNLLTAAGTAVAPGSVVRGRVRRAVIGARAVVNGDVTAAVIGADAIVDGDVTRTVVWPGARVDVGEHLRDAIRLTDGTTVDARSHPPG